MSDGQGIDPFLFQHFTIRGVFWMPGLASGVFLPVHKQLIVLCVNW